MKTHRWSWGVLCTLLCAPPGAGAQSPAGALAIDERQGERYGWAVDYESAEAARDAVLRECGAGCTVVLTFGRCGAYATQEGDAGTTYGWGESRDTADDARQRALAECRSRGGSSCSVRVSGCNGPAVEESLGLDRAARRRIQVGLRDAGFDPGAPDGLFGPRTRAAIRSWQAAGDSRATGYLDSAAAEALRSSGPSGPAPTVDAPSAADVAAVAGAAADSDAATVDETAPGGGTRQPGAVFQDCDACPEMVVMPGGRLALGRYEVTVGEYEAFSSATGAEVGSGCYTQRRLSETQTGPALDPSASWLDPGFPQTSRHPVVCVSWHEAQEYVSWLSRTTGATYRLPNQDEWSAAAGGSVDGCGVNGRDRSYEGWHNRRFGVDWDLSSSLACLASDGAATTAAVGSYGATEIGLSDMVGNVWEWTEDCWEGDCSQRVARGGSWQNHVASLHPSGLNWDQADARYTSLGLRVAKTLGGP